jgi:predicted transposase YdaD
MAPISAVTESQLPGLVKRMEQRLSDPRGRKQASLIWRATNILLGLRHSPALAAQLFRGVMSMKESSTYQAILEEGRSEGAAAEAKKVLRILGEDAFGVPDARMSSVLEKIDDLSQLEDLLRRVRIASSWHELLGSRAGESPKSRRRTP